MIDAGKQTSGVPTRAATLMLVAVICLSFIGLVVGIDYGVPKSDAPDPALPIVMESSSIDEVLPSMGYAEIRTARIGPTRKWRYGLDQLPQPEVDLFRTFTPSDEAKRVSLALRSERRAFNGAPPVIPHAVQQISSSECMACHGEGFLIENRTARQLPHPFYANCMQCHAPPAPDALPYAPFDENSFDGVSAPWSGARAWTGAPPVVPHSTWMRDNCLACHGPTGWPGMETTHPWRENCLQCHAPSAGLDQAPFAVGPEFADHPPVVDQPQR